MLPPHMLRPNASRASAEVVVVLARILAMVFAMVAAALYDHNYRQSRAECVGTQVKCKSFFRT